ncbi:uncharacterized protein BJ171DRAFT_205496 [Polychytrium aggregatum]|uniref:uncharacterized protein n=1 Tax=Polychytrium aggregatum TaxID=110093 RepID=UPI0022FECC6B|nr:uncharacterized protein BJ171DRAFT_205496 [Polychytrium aggregatum]KAI9199642.1 hypothetical protein BJ171DRAFT_205496 [Polychytrium aggregatum]
MIIMESSASQALINLSHLSQQPDSQPSADSPAPEVPVDSQALPTTPPPSLLLEAITAEHARQLLISQMAPHVNTEAVSFLFDAGYETIESVRSLNINLNDPHNDISAAEIYTKRTLKPGYRKQIIQFVANHNPHYHSLVFDHAQQLLGLSPPGSSPSRKRRRTETDVGSDDSSQQVLQSYDLNTLLLDLERHLNESPVTRHLRKDIDYHVGIEQARLDRGPEGIWKCLICSSRPVTISLRNGGRQPQLSNVGTHLKTIKHTHALNSRQAHFADGTAAVSAAAAMAAAAVAAQQQEFNADESTVTVANSVHTDHAQVDDFTEADANQALVDHRQDI